MVVREEQAVKVSRLYYAQPAFPLFSAMLQTPDAEIWLQAQVPDESKMPQDSVCCSWGHDGDKFFPPTESYNRTFHEGEEQSNAT